MNWRQWIGLKPTQADLARELLLAAQQSGDTSWRYDAAASALRHADRVINLGNIHQEYAQASYLTRPTLLKKYRAMIAPAEQAKVAQLWTVAQTCISPIVRSRYERMTLEIQSRQKNEPLPPRAAKAFLGSLDIVIGYDHGQTIAQVSADEANVWGLTLDDIIARARANLRSLPTPTWQSAGASVWTLQSPDGYIESFLQLPKIFDSLPAKGTRLAMIPNRGVLLATGTDEPNGTAALLTAAKRSIQEAPWPLSGDLFRIAFTGAENHTLSSGRAVRASCTRPATASQRRDSDSPSAISGAAPSPALPHPCGNIHSGQLLSDAQALASIQKLDLSSI